MVENPDLDGNLDAAEDVPEDAEALPEERKAPGTSQEID